MAANNSDKPLCRYGEKCYQKNPSHHRNYMHPKETDTIVVEPVNKKMKTKAGTFPSSLQDQHKAGESTTFLANQKDEKQTPMTLFTIEREFIREKFLVEMPQDFFSFWNFCQEMSKDDPSNSLKDVGLTLVGPFDVLARKLTNGNLKQNLYLRHWRYYYDPPEFQTVLKGDDRKQYHIGYFRDDPKENPCFVASNCAAVDGIIKQLADNLFGAVSVYMENLMKTVDPFRRVRVDKLRNTLQIWAKKEGFTLAEYSENMKSRNRKVVTKTFHGAGLVVPYNRKTELGYRSLIETDASLKKILSNIVKSKSDEEKEMHFSKLEGIVSAAVIANDECDFGTSLELGLDLFSFGGDVFNNTISTLMSTSYHLLDRPEFAQIIKAHLENRRRGSDLSLFEEK